MPSLLTSSAAALSLLLLTALSIDVILLFVKCPFDEENPCALPSSR